MRAVARLARRAFAREVRVAELAQLRPQRQVINLPEHLVEEKRTEEGELIHHRLMTDDQFLRASGHNVPSPERRSAYYSLVRDGKRYHVFNADRKPYGEIVARAAALLCGKLKPVYARNRLCAGDAVVIVNADKILMRGDRLKQHKVRYHTGSPGGLKTRFTKHLLYRKPESVFIQGIYRVLPHTQLRQSYLQNLHVNVGPRPLAFAWLPGFAAAPHPDRNALLGLPLDAATHKIVYADGGPLPEELAGFEQDLRPLEELVAVEPGKKLSAHIQGELRRYNAWVSRTRQKMKDWRARPPRAGRNEPFKDSFVYYYHSDRQAEKYPFLREFFADSAELGEEGEKD